MKIFYHSDNDGKCAAFLVKHFIKSDEYTNGEPIEFIEMNYGYEFPTESIRKDEYIFIVDFSIDPAEMCELLKITQNVYWIDHHESAIKKYEDFEVPIKGFRKSGIAGCMLTYCYLKFMLPRGVYNIKPYMIDTAPYFVKLIADYDIWEFAYDADTRRFEKGSHLYDLHPDSSIWTRLLHDSSFWNEIALFGKTIIDYRKSLMTTYCKSKGFETSFEGYKCYAVNMAMLSSDDFIIENPDDFDILIGFSFDGEKWTYSLRSTKVNCATLASKYGGGGHAGAAGFSSKELLIKRKMKESI